MSGFRSALLVHGGGGGGWEWDLWCDVLASAELQVVAPDLQPARQGLSATRFIDYQEQLERLLEGLPRPRVVMGASLGGLLALRIAAQADALVLVNPLPPSPWHRDLPARTWPDVVPWRRNARLASTRQALPDADEASALFAFRRWRDEAGAVLREAYSGVAVERPACRVLFVLSDQDEDVPVTLAQAMASEWERDTLQTLSPSHVGPLLGRHAAGIAAQSVAWLNSEGPTG